ncbi:hypothetical protein Tco_0996510 [Tanacetum coccineum]
MHMKPSTLEQDRLYRQFIEFGYLSIVEDVYLLVIIEIVKRTLEKRAVYPDEVLLEITPVHCTFGRSISSTLLICSTTLSVGLPEKEILRNSLRSCPLISNVESSGQVEFFEGWKPLSPLQLAVEEAICNKCLFDANHDMCLIDFVNDVNVRSKSKSKRNKIRKAWKPTGKVFTDVGYKWKPTGRFFTIVGNSCPLTRITPKKIVHLKETTSKLVETPKPDIKVYSRRPKQIKSVGSSKKAKIIESKIANNLEPTHLWGSNATDVPSSSSLVNDRLSRSSSGIWTLDVQNI